MKSKFLVLLAASLLAQGASASILFESHFDGATTAWGAFTVDPGGVVGAQAVTLAPANGNPGGALQVVAPSEGATSFFRSPNTLGTALHSAIGGSISWDISTVRHQDDVFYTSPADIQVTAPNGIRIRLSLLPTTAPLYSTFESLQVGFSEADNWIFFDGTNTINPPHATQAQIDSVLSTASFMIIRAEYWSGNTPDTTFLDNVVLRSVPEPATLALVGAALLGVAATRRRKP